MARMPNVPFLGVSGNGNMTRWDVVCIHTIVGFAAGGKPAHFTTDAKGTIVQVRDTVHRSAANLNGNHRVIAVENEDHGSAYGAWSGSNVPPFTAAQCEAIAKICVWAHQTHGIPLVLCPDSKPTSRGIAYHRQGIDGNWGGYAYGGRVPGGEVWSTSSGKVCPGDRRIRQLINVIIPRARVLAGSQQSQQEVDDVSFQEVLPSAWNPTYSTTASVWITTTAAKVEALLAKVDAIQGALSDDEANIIAAIRALGTVDVDEAALAAALAPAVAPLLQAGATPDQIEAAVRHVFADAATEGDN